MGKGSEKGCGCLTAVVFALWIWFTLVLSPDSNSGVRYGAIGEFSYGRVSLRIQISTIN